MHHLSNTRTRWKAKLKKVPGLVPLVRLCRIVISPAYRSERRLMRTRPDNLFQPYALTAFDRHPRVFSYVREHVPDGATTRILSFGCSTGEEVFSLRHYFPQAEIVGIDINPHNIAVCRKKLQRNGDLRIRFALAGTPDTEPAASYDAVFCMSVLRHGELGETPPESCEHLPFCRLRQGRGGIEPLSQTGRLSDNRRQQFSFLRYGDGIRFRCSVRRQCRRAARRYAAYGPDNRWLRDTVYNDVIFLMKAKA